MKKFLILVCILFVSVAIAESLTVTWYNIDGTTYTNTTCEPGGTITLPVAPNIPGYTFLGWKPYYTRIKYLEATGGEVISTGTTAYQNTKVRIKFNVANSGLVFGFFNGPSQEYRFFVSPSLLMFDYGSQATRLTANTTSGQIRDILFGNLYIKDYATNTLLAGTEQSSPVAWHNDSDLSIFSLSWPASVGDRIYLLQIWQGDTLVRDMIPVVHEGTVCMYDKVSDTFFYNISNSGRFIAGPIITD